MQTAFRKKAGREVFDISSWLPMKRLSTCVDVEAVWFLLLVRTPSILLRYIIYSSFAFTIKVHPNVRSDFLFFKVYKLLVCLKVRSPRTDNNCLRFVKIPVPTASRHKPLTLRMLFALCVQNHPGGVTYAPRIHHAAYNFKKCLCGPVCAGNNPP